MSARGTERAPASRCPATARGEGVHWTRPAPKVAAPYIAPGPYPSFSYDALDPFCLPLWGPPPARSLAGGEASTELGRVPPERSEASTGGVHIRGPPRGAARTGKEEDTEVGLTYFGKRFLNAQLGRWVSADPLGVHAPGGADLNLYAYVKGLLLKAVDPVGLEPFSVASYMSGGAVEEGIDSVDALAGHEDAVQWAPASSAAAQDAAIEPATPVPPRAERDVAAAKGVVNGAVQFVAEGAASTAAALEYATAGTAKLLAPEAPWPSTILSMGGEALQLDVGENPHLQDAANEQTFGVKVFLGMASVAAGVRSGGSVTSGAARQPAGRTGPATAVPGESVAAVGVPAPGSLTNEATRHWYHAQLDAIPSRIDPSLPLRDRALQAFTMRNEIKLQARSLMADRAAADSLPAPSTLQDVVRRAYNQGLRGDDVWRYVLGGSQRSNAGVDAALGISR